MAKPNADHLIAELRSHGVTEYRIEHGGKHPRLLFTWRGQEMHFVFPASPGDSASGALNAVSSLRRIMGVQRVPRRKSAYPPRTRAKPGAAPMPDSFTVRPDPWQALAPMMARMRGQGDALGMGRGCDSDDVDMQEISRG